MNSFCPEVEDRSIEWFLPRPDVAERQELEVRAPAEVVFEVVEHFELLAVPMVRWIFRMREWLMRSRGTTPRDHRPFLESAREMGWGTLAFRPGREVVMGAQSRPWLADVTFEPIPADDFAAAERPDRVKIAWSIECHPIGAARTRLSSETRVGASDAAARAKFARYWRWARFGIVGIRWLLLPAIRREAEERWRERNAGARPASFRPVEPRNAHALPR